MLGKSTYTTSITRSKLQTVLSAKRGMGHMLETMRTHGASRQTVRQVSVGGQPREGWDAIITHGESLRGFCHSAGRAAGRPQFVPGGEAAKMTMVDAFGCNQGFRIAKAHVKYAIHGAGRV